MRQEVTKRIPAHSRIRFYRENGTLRCEVRREDGTWEQWTPLCDLLKDEVWSAWEEIVLGEDNSREDRRKALRVLLAIRYYERAKYDTWDL